MKFFEHDTVKTSRTFYTDEKIRNAKKNIERFDRARKEKERVVQLAEEYLAYGINNLLTYVTQQNLPRSYSVNEMKGCPVCGKDIDRFGNYPYIADIFQKPFKLQCPNCQSVFPSNDFDSYYKSGLDENGRFHYEKADPKYLVNELYPDKPSDWCTDNGFGWVDPEGCKTKSYSYVYDKEKGIVFKETTVGDNRYTFIAYYNHWFIWMTWQDKTMVTGAISALRDAYLYTDDPKYAKAGLMLLNRVADFYKEFDACIYKWEDNFRHSGGAWGKIVGAIWEESVVNQFAKAYDAFFPAITEDTVREINAHPFYKSNPQAPNTTEDIKRNIENNILYQILPEVKNHRIRGNFGMHQESIALAALVLQNEEYFRHSIDAIMSFSDGSSRGIGNIEKVLIDEIDHDGCGNETSIGYNGIWLNTLSTIADILRGTPSDLYKNIKFLKMHNLEIPSIIADRYTLNIGDSGHAGNPETVVNINPHIALLQNYADVTSARLLDLAQRVKKEKGEEGAFYQNMFVDWEKTNRNIAKIVEKHGPFRSVSENYSGYGLAKYEIRNEAQEPRSVWMYYGRNTGHAHKDTLMLGFFGYGVFLNPDHGYPCYTDGNFELRNWTGNTLSHDTVLVGEEPGNNHVVGIPHHYDAKESVGVMDIEAPLLYEQTSCYRRTAITVNRDGIVYTVDLFRVAGGNDHRYVFHGAEGEAQATGLNPVAQKRGTYAGEEVEFASEEYDRKSRSGFNYLYDIKRDPSVKGSFTVDWKIKDTFKVWEKDRDVHIAITVLDPPDEAVLAKGQQPQNKPGNPKEYTYLILHNKGEDIESQFAALIESYENDSAVLNAEALPIACEDGSDAGYLAKAVKVTMKNGRIDYILNAIDQRTYVVGNGEFEFKGFLAIISEKDGRVCYKYANDLSYLKFMDQELVTEDLFVTGTVIDFTKESSLDNTIVVKLDTDVCPSKLFGAYTDIETDKIRNGCYKVLSAEKNKDGLYELNIGDITLIRAATGDVGQYEYNIANGAQIRIPLSEEERR
jgi:hypothetical protein